MIHATINNGIDYSIDNSVDSSTVEAHLNTFRTDFDSDKIQVLADEQSPMAFGGMQRNSCRTMLIFRRFCVDPFRFPQIPPYTNFK